MCNRGKQRKKGKKDCRYQSKGRGWKVNRFRESCVWISKKKIQNVNC